MTLNLAKVQIYNIILGKKILFDLYIFLLKYLIGKVGVINELIYCHIFAYKTIIFKKIPSDQKCFMVMKIF